MTTGPDWYAEWARMTAQRDAWRHRAEQAEHAFAVLDQLHRATLDALATRDAAPRHAPATRCARVKRALLSRTRRHRRPRNKEARAPPTK